jgi:hypothetical protein
VHFVAKRKFCVARPELLSLRTPVPNKCPPVKLTLAGDYAMFYFAKVLPWSR